jgi:hypothetical protein
VNLWGSNVNSQQWGDREYCWVVICKNYLYHYRQHIFHGHKIPLGVTDAIANRPAVSGRFSVCCDDCGKEYLYGSSEVLRHELEPPESFIPHSLFKDE